MLYGDNEMNKALIKPKPTIEFSEFIFASLPCRAEFRDGELVCVNIIGTEYQIEIDAMDKSFTTVRTLAETS